MEFLCTEGHGGKAQGLGFIGLKIIIQDLLELFQDALVNMIAGNKLPVVKTGTVIQQ
jgi:hypothetical protein